jgi:hypothetical protein
VSKTRLIPIIAISPLEQMGILRSSPSAALWAPCARTRPEFNDCIPRQKKWGNGVASGYGKAHSVTLRM